MKHLLLILIAFTFSVQAQKPWKHHIIDNSSSGADGVKLADINLDGYQDIVTGWEEGGITKLYLHPGKEKVKEKWPSVTVGKTPNVEDAVFVDMNNDGRVDVVSCTENHSEKIFVHWNKGKNLLDTNNWKQEILSASEGEMMWMYAEPLQLDNKNGLDLIAAGKGEKSYLGWFESPAQPNNLNDWHWYPISPVGWIMSILKRDMDGDGDTDIVISDRYGKLQACRWLENPGHVKEQKGAWQSHFIGAKNLEVMFICMADIDGDKEEEAIVCERSKQTIRIYKRTDKQGLDWDEKTIQIPVFTGSAKSIEVGDLNNDGVCDLILSTNTNGIETNGLIWLNGKKINQAEEMDWQVISGAHNSKYDKVELIDIDKDGDLDILVCEENYGENSTGLGVVWYENTLKE